MLNYASHRNDGRSIGVVRFPVNLCFVFIVHPDQFYPRVGPLLRLKLILRIISSAENMLHII